MEVLSNMQAYFEYLRDMFERVMGHIGYFLYKAFISPWTDLPKNFGEYNDRLANYSGAFGFWGWFFYVLFMLLLIGFHLAGAERMG